MVFRSFRTRSASVARNSLNTTVPPYDCVVNRSMGMNMFKEGETEPETSISKATLFPECDSLMFQQISPQVFQSPQQEILLPV
jgi:hypothetical protein